MQDKPDLTNIVFSDLPDKVFYESSTPFHHPSPTGSIITCQTLAESVNALAAACMPDPSQVKLTEENMKAQAGKNRDDVVKRLLETKRQLQSEPENELSRKYEKILIKELNLSSNSDCGSDSSISISLN